jgi:hypothetical protein
MEKEKLFGSEGVSVPNEEVVKSPKTGVGKANLDKYKDFTAILNDDLRKFMDRNITLNNEINEAEEARQYYLGKLMNVMNFCKKFEGTDSTEIVNIITHVPEDFK